MDKEAVELLESSFAMDLFDEDPEIGKDPILRKLEKKLHNKKVENRAIFLETSSQEEKDLFCYHLHSGSRRISTPNIDVCLTSRKKNCILPVMHKTCPCCMERYIHVAIPK